MHVATLLFVPALQPLYSNLTGYFFVYQNNGLTQFLLQLLMASNATIQNAVSFNGPIWSMSVEVLVYFFFMMLLMTRSWLVNLAVIAISLLVPGQVADCFAFYAGGSAAMARRAVTSSVHRRAAESAGWLSIIVFLLCAWQSTNGHLVSTGFVLLLICTPMLLFCLSRDILLPAPLQRFVEAAGNMTYWSYLLHFPIQLMAVLGFAFVRAAPVPLYDSTFFGLFIGTTLLAAYLTYRYSRHRRKGRFASCCSGRAVLATG